MMSNSFPLNFSFKNTMARCAFFPKQYAAAKRANHNKAYLKNSVVKLAGFFKIYRVKICHRAKTTITTIRVANRLSRILSTTNFSFFNKNHHFIFGLNEYKLFHYLNNQNIISDFFIRSEEFFFHWS